MDRLVPPPDAHHAVEADGEVSIWAAGPEIVIQQASGTLSLPLARCLTGFYRSFLRPEMNDCRVFAEFDQLNAHTREAREHMNAFAVETISRFSAVHFLISSKFVALALSTLKDEVGSEHVHVYSDRESFLQSLADALQARGASTAFTPSSRGSTR